MTTLQSQVDELFAEHRRVKQEFQTKAQALFKNVTRTLFDSNPYIKCIVWTQYTPYFNDGDTCEFGVNDPYFSNAEGDEVGNVSAWGEYEGDLEDCVEVFSSYDLRKGTLREGVDLQLVSEFESMLMSSEMRDVLEEMFGDHVKVTVTREGFDVTDYEHD